jgi:Putative phage serine protease XkdF
MTGAPLQIVKVSDELRLVFGWANVTLMDGEEVVDTQNDVMESQVLVKAFMDFMSSSRTGGLMHLRDEAGAPVGVGEVVFAFPFTADLKKAFGIEMPAEGVVIGFRADDDAVWKAVKDGKLQAFSIGGRAVRTPVDDDEDDDE